MLNKKIASEIAIGIILLLAIAVGGIFYWQNQKSIQQPGQRACTMEAKLCDDGSYVSRTGPNCEFTECPTNSAQQPVTNNQQMVGNDKDEHGCIGSAGYTWCGLKQKCLRTWEEKCEKLETSDCKTYINNKYGFKLTFPDRWKNCRIIERGVAENIEKESGIISFQLKGKGSLMLDDGTTEKYGDVFVLQVYDLSWWKNNAEVDSYGEAYIKNSEHNLGNSLGIYVTKNNNYVITYTTGQDDEGTLGFPEVVPNQQYKGPFYDVQNLIIPSFKFIK